MPKYDFRCTACGDLFELTRSFSQSDDPAACPRDGAEATRLFSPPLELLMYRREPVVDTGPVRIPPGTLSCHDHGPPPTSGEAGHVHRSGSQWHAHGYENAGGEDGAGRPSRVHSHDHGHAHGHAHPHGHAHRH